MPIITISRGSYSRGKEIAEKVAERLAYKCISRDTLIEASKQFNIPEIKLIRAIHDAPSILERFGYGKEKYITYIQTSLLRQVRDDNVVYHGLAGQFLLEGISHVLRVRIISDMEDRVTLEMERENVSREKAMKDLISDDDQRRRWSKFLFNIDISDPSLYDLILHIQKLNSDDAADIICFTAKLPDFQNSPQSQKTLEDKLMATEVKAALIDVEAGFNVSAYDGVVTIETKKVALQAERPSYETEMYERMKSIAESIEGVKEVKINPHHSNLAL